MNKEEILARSKKENIYGDEREKSVRTKRDAWLRSMIVPLWIMKCLMAESRRDIR